MSSSRGARPMAGDPGWRCASMSSSSPSPKAARWSSSWTGMSCSIEPRIMRVGLISSSTPRWRKSASFLGLFTRRDGPRHVEVVLGHLADDEVVLVSPSAATASAGSPRPRRGTCPRSRRGRSRSTDLVGDLPGDRGPSPSGPPRGPRRAAPWPSSTRPCHRRRPGRTRSGLHRRAGAAAMPGALGV